MGKKSVDMTPEEREIQLKRLAEMREKARKARLAIGEASREKQAIKQELKEHLNTIEEVKAEKMVQKIEESKQEIEALNTVTTPPIQHIKPNLDEVRRQIEAEMKAKYKTKYKDKYGKMNMPFMPMYGMHPGMPYQQHFMPPPEPPKQTAAVKEIIKQRVSEDAFKLLYDNIFPNG